MARRYIVLGWLAPAPTGSSAAVIRIGTRVVFQLILWFGPRYTEMLCRHDSRHVHQALGTAVDADSDPEYGVWHRASQPPARMRASRRNWSAQPHTLARVGALARQPHSWSGP